MVRYFGVVLSKPNYALVMEYCAVRLPAPGAPWATSLHALLSETAVAVPWRERLHIASGVAAGMQHLHNLRVGPHKRTIVHGDLKASNVLLTAGGPFDDSRWTPRISDFGLSRLSKGTLSRSDSGPGGGGGGGGGRRDAAAGTLAWIAPELLPPAVRRATQESDVYSFGVLLWEIAARKGPFAGRDPRLLPAQVRGGARPELPFGLGEEMEGDAHGGALLAAMRRCWAGDPGARPDFVALSNELGAALRGAGAGAAPPA